MSTLTTVCPHCGIDQPLNVVLAPARRDGTIAAMMLCPRCDMPVTAVLRRGAGSVYSKEWFFVNYSTAVDLLTFTKWEIVETFPPRKGRRAPEHTPDDVVRIYQQACSNHARGEMDAAAIMFGKTIEASIRILDADLKGTLNERIERLAGEGKLSPDLVKWAHEVRIVRNDAAHDLAEPNPHDIAEISEFTEAFLLFAFTMPKKFENRQSRKQDGKG